MKVSQPPLQHTAVTKVSIRRHVDMHTQVVGLRVGWMYAYLCVYACVDDHMLHKTYVNCARERERERERDGVYRIAGKFGGELNLAVWRSSLRPPN